MSEKEEKIGLRLRFDPGVDLEIRKLILNFATWLRKQIMFPIRVTVYIKECEYVRTKDGTRASALFWEPKDRSTNPYIKLPTGDFPLLVKEWGKLNALGSILLSLGHEIAHYEQWIGEKSSSCKSASRRASRLVNRYFEEGYLDCYKQDS